MEQQKLGTQFEQNNKRPLGMRIVAVIAVMGVLLFGIQTVAKVLFVKDMGNIVDSTKDIKRKRDLNEINEAIQIAVAEGGIELIDTTGCRDCSSDVGSHDPNGTGWVKYKYIPDPSGMEMYKHWLSITEEGYLPIDPINKKPYVYEFASDGESFELNAIFTHDLDSMTKDKGNNPDKYEIGTNLKLID